MAAFWHRNDSLVFAEYLIGSAIEGNPSKGAKMIERLAERGYVEAQLKLGGVYQWGVSNSSGVTIKPNIPAAIKWLKRAADQGDKRGYDELWQIYLHEGNVDEEKALHFLLIAAQKGCVNAQWFLGICYMQGSILPVPQNYSEGLKWLRKVARADGSRAQIELAKAYRDGTGVSVDLIKSYIWFSIAARAELANQRSRVDDHKKREERTKEFAKPIGESWPQIPIKIEKGEAQIERDKIAAGFTTSQLIDAQNLVERYIANNYEDLD